MSLWKKILITGGSGRLGTELKNYLRGEYPSRRQLDINTMESMFPCDLVVHLASYTNVDEAQTHPFDCFRTNVIGTYNLLSAYRDVPFVFVSSEHAGADGVYFQSKLVGEMMVKSLAKSYLIIRTLFKPRPYPWEYAFTDQVTQGDYVDVIAKIIAKEVLDWDGKSKIIFAGTGKKTMFDLAKQTRPDVKPNSVNDMKLKRPKFYA